MKSKRKPAHRQRASAKPPPAAGRTKAGAARAGAKPARRKPDKTLPASRAQEIEQRIIESLGDPAQRPLTIGQRCLKLGISRSAWYSHLADPLFAARARQAWRQCSREELGQIMQALVSSALLDGRDGFRDRQLYLELIGEYEPGQKLRVEAAASAKAAKDLGDEELLLLFEGRESLLPIGVLRRLGRDPDAEGGGK